MTEPLHIYVAMKTLRFHAVRPGSVVRAVVMASVLWACQPLVAQVVTPFQPDVRWGGRSVSVSVNPSNTAEAIAGTERGGLFKTRDGGTTWRHIDRLTMSRIHDVRYAPASPDGTNVVIATGPDDTRVTNQGGIWRSIDGGETWVKPSSSNPPCVSRASAYGISFQSGSPNIYVGTDCGLAISRDFGVTWRHFRSPNDDPGATPIGRVLSVAARAGGLIDIGGDGLIDNNGDGWVDANTGTGRRGHIRFTYDGRSFAIVARQMDVPDSFNSVTASPVEPGVVYVATGSGLTELHGPIRPGTGGMLVRFDVTPDGCCRTGRQNWVAATPSRDGRRDHVDVYFSDGYQTWRRTCETTGAAPRCRRGGWDRLGVDHEDHNGIAFDPDHPGHILIGTEAAGIFRSIDGGLSWGSIPGTRQIPSVSSFFFIPESPTNPNAEVVVSSYGRGLWKLSIPPGTEVRPYNISPIIPAWGNWVRQSLTGAPEAKNVMQPGGCPACRWLIAVGGRLDDLRLDAKQQVTALALDKGARLVGSTWDGRPLTVDQALLSAMPPDGGKDKFIGCAGCQDLVKRGGAVRGLVLEGTTVRAIIGGEGKLPNEDMVAKFVPSAVAPRDAPLAPQPTGPVLIATGTVPGTNVAFVGASVPVGGSGFCPSTRCGKLEIRVGERVAALVEVNAKGEFDANIVLTANDGGDRRVTPNTLTATQKDQSGKLITTRTTLLVALSSDEPPKRQ